MHVVEEIGFYRLTLIPLGIAIIAAAITDRLWGMGIIGVIVAVFGVLNKCLLLGRCDADAESSNKNHNASLSEKPGVKIKQP